MVNSKGKLLTLTLTLKRLSVQSSRQLLQYSWQLLGVPVNKYFDKLELHAIQLFKPYAELFYIEVLVYRYT